MELPLPSPNATEFLQQSQELQDTLSFTPDVVHCSTSFLLN